MLNWEMSMRDDIRMERIHPNTSRGHGGFESRPETLALVLVPLDKCRKSATLYQASHRALADANSHSVHRLCTAWRTRHSLKLVLMLLIT